jgi:carbon-monoxide dehydrogenase small subunit
MISELCQPIADLAIQSIPINLATRFFWERFMNHDITLTVNGDTYHLSVAPWRTLNDVLREDLNLTGTKLGCGSGDCGACTVMVDGKSISSCLTLAVEMDGRQILTVEGLAPSGENLHPIQEAFIEKGAIQCGFCTPGMEISALNLLSANPTPNETDIRTAISGNLCRCTGYNKIVDAIAAAGRQMKPKGRR